MNEDDSGGSEKTLFHWFMAFVADRDELKVLHHVNIISFLFNM